jgi:hypothetical protein
MTCSHGFQKARCARCNAETTATARRRTSAVPAATPPSEEHRGWNIFYEPAVSGWQVRAPEAATMEGSFRSLFLARKAVDEWIANPPPARASNRRG